MVTLAQPGWPYKYLFEKTMENNIIKRYAFLMIILYYTLYLISISNVK